MTGTQGRNLFNIFRYGQDKNYYIYILYNMTNHGHHNGEKFKSILS